MLDLFNNARLEARQARYEKKLRELKATRVEIAKNVARENANEIQRLRQSSAYAWLAARLSCPAK